MTQEAPLVFNRNGKKNSARTRGVIETYTSRDGAFASIRKSRYPACRLKNFCFSHDYEKAKRTYFFVSDDPSFAAQEAALKAAMSDCMWMTAKQATFRIVGSESLPSETRWYNGSTYLMQKIEVGHHPAAWGRMWAALLSNFAWDPDFLELSNYAEEKHKISQLTNYGYSLNGWEEFYMHVALESARIIAPNAWADLVEYIDTAAIQNEETQSATVCFENGFTLREANHYYYEKEEVELFRQVAHRMLGVAPRQSPCRAEDIKVVFLQRSSRPFWNADDVLNTLKASGLTNIQLASISERTPFFQQALLFYEADLVVSVHGSQLGNLVFMPEHAGVVQLFPHKYFSGQPASLANVFGQTHYAMVTNPLPPAGLVEASGKDEYVENLRECQKLSAKFADYTSCVADRECRFAMRAMGVYADLGQVSSVARDFIDKLVSRSHCHSRQ